MTAPDTRNNPPLTDVARCTYRACPDRPTRAVQGEYDAEPWYGCDAHWPAMAKALGYGQRIDYSVTVTPLHWPSTPKEAVA